MRILFLALVSISFFTSCNTYESKVPLGTPGETKLDVDFYGKWILSEEKKTEEVFGNIEIIPFNENEYLVQISEYADSSDYIQSILNFRMFPTIINKNEYFNLQLLNNEEQSGFSIYQLKSISGNRYKLLFLSKEHFEHQFESTPDFRNYVENHQKDFNNSFITEGILSRYVEK